MHPSFWMIPSPLAEIDNRCRSHQRSETGPDSLQRSSKAQAEQVRSIDVKRLGPRIGQLPPFLIDELDEALRLHLGL
jgi:mRNA-degrading endonuclease toxin of MazEF toxin-antitoxin module